MRICVIAPTEEYLQQAGVRIRYQRIQPIVKKLGLEISIALIDTFRASTKLEHDVYLFSKCVDARACLVASMLKRAEKWVAVDLFDDYFSQADNSKFISQREWLRTMASLVDFYLCSTGRMKRVAERYIPAPGHVLNDPYDVFDSAKISATVERKLDRANATKQIELAWFGIGDNSHFPVGLHDLHAFDHTLHQLASGGYAVNLSILTNRRALTVAGLEKLQRLPVPFSVEEWTVEKETELLARSLAAFIPVNAQNFSIAKSMNRAVTALASGNQVISAGFPLYGALGEFIYRSPGAFLHDIENRNPALRANTVEKLREVFAVCADTEEEVEKLGKFLGQLVKDESRRKIGSKTTGLIHGVTTSADCHKQAQRLGHLSISTPFSVSEKLNYDVRFSSGSHLDHVEVQLDDKALPKLRADLKAKLKRCKSVTGRDVQALDVSTMFPVEAIHILRGSKATSTASRLVAYRPAMQAIESVLDKLFPGIQTCVSEKESPFYSGLVAGLSRTSEIAPNTSSVNARLAQHEERHSSGGAHA